MGRLTAFSIRNRALVALATVFGLLAGLWSASALPRELFPSIQLPVLAVITPSPGTSASVMESQVTSPIEIAAQGLGDVVEVQSTSQEGFSSVLVELDYGTDTGFAQTELQRAVLALPNLPEGTDPQIVAGNISDFPIIQLAATGGSDGADLVDRLERFVLPEVEDIPGVRSAELQGVADRVLTVDLDTGAAEEVGVGPDEVIQVLRANGVAMPGGQVLDGSAELPVQVGSRLTSVDEVRELPVVTPGTLGARQEALATNARVQEAGEGAPPTEDLPADAPPSAQLPADALPAPDLEEVEVPDIPALGDLAEVTLEDRPATAYTRTNGETSVGLSITRTPDGNEVEISRDLAALLPELEATLDGGELVTIFDGAPFIEDSIEDLATEGVLGLGFAVLVVLVFLLSVRLTLVTAVSIPLSLLLAVLGLQVAGYSLNILTLGALTITVGRVVDDSIVVIENIKRHAGLGRSRREAVVTGTREVATAITSSTVCTVAVFLPLGFVGGAVGELFRPFAVTVSLAMLTSLLVALTIIPVLGYWFLGSRSDVRDRLRAEADREAEQQAAQAQARAEAERARREQEQRRTASRGLAGRLRALLTRTDDGEESSTAPTAAAQTARAAAPVEPQATTAPAEETDTTSRWLQKPYLPTLRWTLAHPWLTLLIAALVAGGTVYGATTLRTDFIGDPGQNTLQASLTLPTGTQLEETDEQARRIEDWLADREEVETFQVTAGSGGGFEALFGGSGANTASFALTLAEGVSGVEFGDDLTGQFLDDLPEGSTFTTTAGGAGGPTSGSLELRVQATDDDDLRAVTDEVTALLADAGAADVENNLDDTVPTLRIDLDRAAAAEHGVVEAQLGRTVQAATSGSNVGAVEIDARTYDVYVHAGDAEDLDDLRDLEIARAPEGEAVTLDEVADLETVEEAASLTRIDGIRAATVTGRSTGDDLGAVTADLRDRIDALDLPDGVQVDLGGVSADQEEAFGALGLALLAAVALVYLVMVATFNSLVQPLILLVSVPFAATGSVLALLLAGMPLDVTAIVGFLMLVGVVVTNAIVLIDLINQYRERGLDRTASVIEGARHRLRPIVMTAAATILALVPMALAITGGGAFLSQPLAVVVIGGLLSSTLLTLILVPVLYELVGRGGAWYERRRDARLARSLRRSAAGS